MTTIQAGLGDVRGIRNTLMLQMPTREDILALQIGDAVHGPLGPSEVVSIHARGEDIDGRAFVCCYLANGENSTVSDSYKENTLERSPRASSHFNSAELDRIEARERERRQSMKTRKLETGRFVAYFDSRPVNGPYGTGDTTDTARADLAEWVRASKQRMEGSHNRV